MATYKFRVEHTGRPFGPLEDVHGWIGLSDHTSLDAAEKAAAGRRSAMHEALGPSAINDHFRVVAIRDTTFTYDYQCATCCAAEESITLPWAADDPKPLRPVLAGWEGGSECSHCHGQWLDIISREYKEDER